MYEPNYYTLYKSFVWCDSSIFRRHHVTLRFVWFAISPTEYPGESYTYECLSSELDKRSIAGQNWTNNERVNIQ